MKSHTGVQTSERSHSPTDTGVKKRAESLREQGSSASRLSEEGREGEFSVAKARHEVRGSEVIVEVQKSVLEDAGEEVAVSEAVAEVPKSALGEAGEEAVTIAEVPESASENMVHEGEACHSPEHQLGPSTIKETGTCHDPEHQPVGPEPLHDSKCLETEMTVEPDNQPVPGRAEERDERHDPEYQSGVPEPLHESTTTGTETAAEPEFQSEPETISSPSHRKMPVLTAIGQAIGLLSPSAEKCSEEPSEKTVEIAVERAPETPAQPDPEILPPLPASPIAEPASLPLLPASPISKPAHDSAIEDPTPITPLDPTMSSEATETSVQTESMPRPFPVFRELPTEPVLIPVSAPPLLADEKPITPSEVTAPSEVHRLSRPRIIVIRATNDSMADRLGSSFTSDGSEDSGNPFESAETTAPKVPVPGGLPPSTALSATNLPDAPAPPNTPLLGTSVPGVSDVPDITDVPLSASDLISEDLGAVNIPGPTSPPRKKKGGRLIRKTRRLVLRSPVLTIILGKQLALLTQPAIKILAEGGELPPMAVVGETVGTVVAPLGAVGAVGKATA